MVNQVNKGNQQNVAYTNSKQLNVSKDNSTTPVQNQPAATAKAATDSVS